MFVFRWSTARLLRWRDQIWCKKSRHVWRYLGVAVIVIGEILLSQVEFDALGVVCRQRWEGRDPIPSLRYHIL